MKGSYEEIIERAPKELKVELEKVIDSFGMAEAAQSTLWQSEKETREAVDAYNQARLRLFEERLANTGKAWCSQCKSIVSRSGVQLLYLEWKWRSRGEYYSDTEGLSRELHQACSACFVAARRRCGDRSFLAFEAELAGDEVQICRFGKWMSLPEGTKREDRLHHHYNSPIPKEIANEWGIPGAAHFSDLHGLKLGFESQEEAGN